MAARKKIELTPGQASTSLEVGPLTFLFVSPPDSFGTPSQPVAVITPPPAGRRPNAGAQFLALAHADPSEAGKAKFVEEFGDPTYHGMVLVLDTASSKCRLPVPADP